MTPVSRPRWRSWLLVAIVALAVSTVPAPAGAAPAGAAPARPAPTPAPRAALSAPGSFTPLRSTRVVDTTSGVGGPQQPLPARGAASVQIGGRAGVPASGASAVLINITVVKPGAKGWLVAYAAGTTRPGVATANWVSGRSTTASVVVRLPADGRVALFNGAARPVEVLVDVAGYYRSGSVTAAGGYVPLTPSRSLDTRHGIGARHSDWTEELAESTAKTLSWPVAGRNGVPSGTRTVLMSITATHARTAGALAAFEDQASNPALLQYLPSPFTLPVLGVPYEAGVPVTKRFVVGLNAAGRAKLSSLDAGSDAPELDAIADVVGYYRGVGATAAGMFQPLAPTRVRQGSIAAGRSVTFAVAVPPGSTVALELNAAKTTGYGALALSTPGTSKPRSQLIYGPGRADATLVYVQVSSTSTVTLTNQSSTAAEVTVDQYGYQRGAALGTGTVWVAGANESAQLAQGTVGVGSTAWSPVTSLSGVVSIASAPNSAYAITTDGTLWAWGNNSDDEDTFNGGQLGDGTSIDRATPVRVKNVAKVTTVVASYQSAYALQADGTVWSWGAGTYGADPDGPLTTRLPLRVPGLSAVVALTGDGTEIIAVRSDGTVWTWSTDPDSVPTPVIGLSGIVDADGNHLLRRDGRVLVDRVVRSGLSDIVAIDGDYATRRDGAVYRISTAQPTVRPPAPTSAAELPEPTLTPFGLSIALL